MKKLILLLFIPLVFACSDDDDSSEINYSIEGKWLMGAPLSNTMYIFEDGIRYTYYCTSEISDDCQSLYESFQANDGNHLPTTNPYTFENNTLTVDLHFGNELVAPVTFECNGDKVNLLSSNPHSLYRLFGEDCN